jgi:hypothetical protein
MAEQPGLDHDVTSLGIYDREGNQLRTLRQYVEEFEKDRTVAKTRIGDVEVSTVFLAVDHSFGFGPPQTFETMIFGGAWDQDMWRYSTEQEAREGHQAICQMVRDQRAWNRYAYAILGLLAVALVVMTVLS